ncbi:prepilin-type N-terminal cleavage/methylation domain-containing protein [Telluria sp. Tellsp104]
MTRQRGFTLVELIVVMVIVGVIAGVLVLQIRPAMQSYLSIRQRANLTSQADTALRRILWEVRTAVPNSLRYTWTDGQNQCIEFVPTKDGGRFRTAADYEHAAAGNPFTRDVATDTFDTLTRIDASYAGDYLFIGNVNGNDVYNPANSWVIKSIADAATTTQGRNTVTLAAPATLPAGYEGGRFVVIPKLERAVTYTCTRQGTDGAGTGTGVIYRVTGYTPSTTPAKTCPATGAILVAKVSDCNFLYRESQGATQQSGYLQLRLGLAEGGESARLTMGAHVENTP